MSPDIALAETIPSHWYTDPKVLTVENERIFLRTWQPVGYASKVAEAGRLSNLRSGGRAAGDCSRQRWRAPRVFQCVPAPRVHHSAGRTAARNHLRCPYHAWTYALDGKLLVAPEFEGVGNWKLSDVCLPQVRVEVWGPFVFVNVDGQAPPLAEVMGDIPRGVAELGCPIDQLHFSYRRDYVIKCNWKVYVDNYLEGYHLPAAHPSLFRELDYDQYRVDTFRYYSSQYAPIRPPRPLARRTTPLQRSRTPATGLSISGYFRTSC